MSEANVRRRGTGSPEPRFEATAPRHLAARRIPHGSTSHTWQWMPSLEEFPAMAQPVILVPTDFSKIGRAHV